MRAVLLGWGFPAAAVRQYGIGLLKVHQCRGSEVRELLLWGVL